MTQRLFVYGTLVPDQFHLGAAALYALLLEFKNQIEPVQMENVLDALKRNSKVI